MNNSYSACHPGVGRGLLKVFMDSGLRRNDVLCVLAALTIFFLPDAVLAQSINIDLGGGDALPGGSSTSRMIQIILAITIIALAPSILVMVTAFTRIVVVLSFLRSALGLQQTPPNQVIVSLALFLTAFVMTPVFEKSYYDGILPLIEEEISEKEAIEKTAAPFHAFMLVHVRDKDIELFLDMREDKEIATPEDTPWQVLVPAFMISELKRAFEIGFMVYVPFLIIDMLVASTLMAMGMMMLPPVLISLPFKLIFFVLVDGWYMLSGSLVKGFGV